jgi:hypothetical protein
MSKSICKLCFNVVLAAAILFGVLPGLPEAHSDPPPVCMADMDPCVEPTRNCCCGTRWTCVTYYSECVEFCAPDEPSVWPWW